MNGTAILGQAFSLLYKVYGVSKEDEVKILFSGKELDAYKFCEQNNWTFSLEGVLYNLCVNTI